MLIVRSLSTLLTLSTAIIIFRFLLIFIYSIKNKKELLGTYAKMGEFNTMMTSPITIYYLISITKSSLLVPIRKGGPHSDSPEDTKTCVLLHLR